MDLIGWFIGGPYLYACLAICVIVMAKKLLGYARMPRHLRWDLYPIVPRGTAGSKYQWPDFYKMKQSVDLWTEIKFMFVEIVFIRKAYLSNPKVWAGSFPLHLGIYLAIKWVVLLIFGIIVENTWHEPVMPGSDSVWISLLYYATVAIGGLGFVSGLCGALFLLFLRFSDEGLRDISDIPAYLNLCLLIALFGSALAAWLTVDPAFAVIRSHLSAVLTFAAPHPLPAPMVAEIFWAGLFLAYLPFSRMLHGPVKYFFYHDVLWDDEPMKPGSSLEQDVTASLGGKLTWSAPHIKQDQSWLAQVANSTAPTGKEGANKK